MNLACNNFWRFKREYQFSHIQTVRKIKKKSNIQVSSKCTFARGKNVRPRGDERVIVFIGDRFIRCIPASSDVNQATSSSGNAAIGEDASMWLLLCLRIGCVRRSWPS
jgi:hypothetical protein